MKIIIILPLILIITLFNSCKEFDDDFLNAPAQSALNDSDIFTDEALTHTALVGVIEPFGQTNSYRGRFIPFYGFNTDNEFNFSSSTSTGDKSDLCVYDTKSTNGQMNRDNNAWAMMFLGIERANKVIYGLKTYNDPKPGTVFGRFLGEALTYRAIYYADLLKAWGDVPARFEPVTKETVYTPKSNRDVVYKQIIADLKEASNLVSWPNEESSTSTSEGINKAFVKGLRARLALVASGYQQYPDEVGKNGSWSVRRSNDPDLSVAKMYKIALDECMDIINSGSASLEPTFEGFWRNFNEENIAAGRESLWEIPFSTGRGRVLFSFAVKHDNDKPNQYTGQLKRGGTAGPLPTVFYDYDEMDSRRDVTCVPYKWGNPINGISRQELTSLDTWYFGKYRYEWMDRYVTASNDDGVNMIYMRYAEVLLMAAEAANELQGPVAAAEYLKEIRRRAFPADMHAEKVDAYVNALSSKEDMFNAIVDEHQYEFTGEMLRKQALIRWNLLSEKLEETKIKLTNLKGRAGNYWDVPDKLYYKYADDGESLEIYGLNRGEIDSPGTDYSEKDWTSLSDDKINALFKEGTNPDDKQFWPIWQVFIDGSNGTLINDYGY